jgi:hypothetical protein
VQQILQLWNVYRRFIPNYAYIVVPITNLLTGNRIDLKFGEAQDAVFLKMTILITSGKTPIIQLFDKEQPVLIEVDAEDCALCAV